MFGRSDLTPNLNSERWLRCLKKARCVEFNPVSVIIRETVTVRHGEGGGYASWRPQPAAPTKTL